MTVTLDTCLIIDHEFGRINLTKLAKQHQLELAIVSVTEREFGRCSIRLTIPESLVWDETPWGMGVWGGTKAEPLVLGESKLGEGKSEKKPVRDRFEFILETISNGAFPEPGKRGNLKKGERRQLRDAMILEAHVREGRELFVSNDRRAFIGRKNEEKRRALEAALKTRIVDREGFLRILEER